MILAILNFTSKKPSAGLGQKDVDEPQIANVCLERPNYPIRISSLRL